MRGGRASPFIPAIRPAGWQRPGRAAHHGRVRLHSVDDDGSGAHDGPLPNPEALHHARSDAEVGSLCDVHMARQMSAGGDSGEVAQTGVVAYGRSYIDDAAGAHLHVRGHNGPGPDDRSHTEIAHFSNRS